MGNGWDKNGFGIEDRVGKRRSSGVFVLCRLCCHDSVAARAWCTEETRPEIRKTDAVRN